MRVDVVVGVLRDLMYFVRLWMDECCSIKLKRERRAASLRLK